MRRRSLCLILVVLVVLAGVIVVVTTREREPEYGGKRLSEWVLQHGEEGAVKQHRIDQAEDAISRIGTSAIPHLLAWGEYRVPPWRADLMQTADKLPESLRFDWMVVDKKYRLAYCVPSAFAVLGDRARAAIPQLAARINDPMCDLETRTWAVYSLAGLGPDALPPLRHALTSAESAIRTAVVGSMVQVGTNALTALPMIIECLRDDDERLAVCAARTLGYLKLEPARVVPALRLGLCDRRPKLNQEAARALANFLADARPAVPDLLRMLEATNSVSRRTASNALRAIDPHALERAAK